MNKRFYLIGFIVMLVLAGCATSGTAWRQSVDKPAGQRFIPVELWNGSRWKGEHRLTVSKADLVFGRRNHKTIKGPFPWKHPKTGEVLQVYERLNNTTKGLKRQIFTVNPDGTGLAKVFDQRPEMPTRYFSSNAVLFPLGDWKVGEKRYFTFDEYVEGKKLKRTAMIYVRRLSFTYQKVDYAMKYDWILTDDTGKMLFHERFIYGPGKSLMYYKNRMR